MKNMQAIITKYMPATNFKPSKMKAQCARGSIVVSYDHGLNNEENHRAACDALCAKFGAEDVAKYGSKENTWAKPKAGGSLPDGRHVFCFIQARIDERKKGT